MNKYRVIIDTREKIYYQFSESDSCKGWIRGKLDTGDYSLEGYEDKLCIERKRNTGEFCTNCLEKRFENELERMKKYKYSFVLCEFSLTDIIEFPINSGIPSSKWNSLKITGNFLLKKLNEFQVKYHSNFVFCDNALNAQKMLNSIFKRVCETECL